MPTKGKTITTTVTQLVEQDDTRESLIIKNATNLLATGTAQYIRISDGRTELDTNEAFLLEIGESIILIRPDGDRVDKSWYARTPSGTGYITLMEHFRKRTGWLGF